MKTFFLVAFTFCFSMQIFASDCNEMTKVRNQFHDARTSTSLKTFLQFIKTLDCVQAYPYYASAVMKQAQYVNSPLKKLEYFKQGKSMLERYIKKYPTDIEARYVRILVQKNVPSILGYSSNIKSDISFIHSHIHTSELSSSYKKTILKYIKS